MKGVISRAVVAAALMTTFSAQALVSNTTKLANANSGVVAAQVNWFDFTGFNRTEAISAAGQAFTADPAGWQRAEIHREGVGSVNRCGGSGATVLERILLRHHDRVVA